METFRDGVERQNATSRFVSLLLLGSVLYALVFGFNFVGLYQHTNGLLKTPHAPFGDDFVNLWAVGKLMLSGEVEKIYLPDAFMAFQRTFIDVDIGARLWAYPPHSLLFAWVAGIGSYFATFWAWSALGVVVLATGARRFGFGWRETTILVLCPASLECIGAGQSGNLACGLMLMALAGGSDRSIPSALAAALLTMKPQSGFLLPLVWLVRAQWRLMALAALATLLLVGLSLALFGLEPWRAYLGSTLPDLSDLERQGSGPFVFMIPSLFMSLRILGFDGDTALVWHSVFAVAVVALLAILLRRNPGARFQSSLMLIATCLVTPYLHVYDLGILLAGALPVLRTVGRDAGPHHLFVIVAVSLAWILPQAVEPFGLMRLPLSPLVVGFVFAVASFSYGSDVARVGSRAAGAAQAKRR